MIPRTDHIIEEASVPECVIRHGGQELSIDMDEVSTLLGREAIVYCQGCSGDVEVFHLCAHMRMDYIPHALRSRQQ